MSEAKPKRRSRRGSPEMNAIQKVYQALKPLEPKMRYRVLSAVNVLLEPAPEEIGGE